MIIDNGARHESKIKSMNLDCPPLSGHIYFWIKKNDLAAGNFDNVWLILQCS